MPHISRCFPRIQESRGFSEWRIAFRPQRAGEGHSRIADYTPGDDRTLHAAAETFRTDATPPDHPRSKTATIAALITITVLVMAAVLAPSHLRVHNPEPPAPELVFAFKALGEMQVTAALDPAEEAKKPIHMRGRVTEKPHRQPVVVRVTVDGTAREHSYRAKGLTSDGPAIDELRQPLTPGPHDITIELIRGPASDPLRWSGRIVAKDRRLHVITYEPTDGFRLENADDEQRE